MSPPVKTDTLVLDFVNEPEQIQEAFQQYYQTTTLPEETDPNRLYDLQTELQGLTSTMRVPLMRSVKLFYDAEKPDELLQGILDSVVARWAALEREDGERFSFHLARVIFGSTVISHS